MKSYEEVICAFTMEKNTPEQYFRANWETAKTESVK